MSMRRAKIVVRPLDDDDPEKKHRAVRQVRLWVWVCVLLGLPALVFTFFWARDEAGHTFSVTSSLAVTATQVPRSALAIWVAGREETLRETPERVRWSVCATSRPSEGDEEAMRQATALASWKAAGPHQIAVLSMAQQQGAEDDAQVVRRSGLKGELGAPWLGSVLRGCEESLSAEYVVLLSGDALLLPSFGAQLSTVLRDFFEGNADRFLIAGPRVAVRNSPTVVKSVAERGEAAMRKEWTQGVDRKDGRAMEVFVWRRGSWKDVEMPDLLVGKTVSRFSGVVVDSNVIFVLSAVGLLDVVVRQVGQVAHSGRRQRALRAASIAPAQGGARGGGLERRAGPRVGQKGARRVVRLAAVRGAVSVPRPLQRDGGGSGGARDEGGIVRETQRGHVGGGRERRPQGAPGSEVLKQRTKTREREFC